ncbi:hypothetical protein G6F40_017256 [Rhizopus arrhizus]|nr:hypothetical protein G6F40_017256 [Rhizopus arrhizus]
MVPGPAVPGSASGTNAMFGVCRCCASAAASDSSVRDSAGGNSMLNPILTTIRPPAMRKPGIEIPKVCMIHAPA